MNRLKYDVGDLVKMTAGSSIGATKNPDWGCDGAIGAGLINNDELCSVIALYRHAERNREGRWETDVLVLSTSGVYGWVPHDVLKPIEGGTG